MPVQQAFGSPSGKSHVAARICALIPKHKTYCEPFAGGAAVFWYKEPSQKEILNDKDPEIAFAYRFIKNMSDEQFKQLSKYSWVGNQKLFEQLKASKPKTPVQRFRRFYYVRRACWGSRMGSFSYNNALRKIDISHFKENRARLKNTTVLNQDYGLVMSKYDSPTTFFYLDPPYPGSDYSPLTGGLNFTMIQFDKLVAQLQKIQGKFILSCPTEVTKRLPKSWHIKRVRMTAHLKLGDAKPIRYELLATNFKGG